MRQWVRLGSYLAFGIHFDFSNTLTQSLKKRVVVCVRKMIEGLGLSDLTEKKVAEIGRERESEDAFLQPLFF